MSFPHGFSSAVVIGPYGGYSLATLAAKPPRLAWIACQTPMAIGKCLCAVALSLHGSSASYEYTCALGFGVGVEFLVVRQS